MRNAFLLAVVMLALTTTAFAQGNLPAGAMKRGSLANAKLTQDAKLGVAAKVATMGCSQPGAVEPFIVAMPSGTVGQRHWTELWIVTGCGNRYPVKIEFSEDGPDAANWTIQR
jgi:hypothetical protein